MQHLLGIILITTPAVLVYAQEGSRENQGSPICGGHLKAPVGTITTPNFPNPFPVPIKCKWIIEHDIVNGTISIYFTQQYTTSGLTFTEYMYYDDTYKLGERRALTVTEENITRIKWLQVQSPVLVVELNLNRLEGTQLRALGLLSVFGFNVTYEVRAPTQSPGPTSCSAIECRLLGHCYATHDYQEFHCSCFEGYSGTDCGVGPLCPASSNMCKNGGTCGQMGPAAVSCICAPGYTGDLCESLIATPECGVEECAKMCKSGTTCDCNPKDTDISSARFDTRLQVVGQSNVNISQEIITQLKSYLQTSNITLEDEIEILNKSLVEANGASTVWVRIWSDRYSAGALRAALARLAAARIHTTRLHLLPDALHIEMQPALNLHTLVVNHRPEVWEGSEFILTCMAYGSPNIAFTWYKDGVKVNFNGTTRDIWTRTVSEDALGRRMSLLGVSESQKPDSGKWSCAADDAGRRRCRALTLTVLRPPEIRLVPSTLTVNKGENVSITCLAGASRVHGALGFSWARERTLLRLAPGSEVWEDLYPAGSVLKLYNVQKSSKFRCQVSSVAGTNAKSMTMWVLGANDEACQSDVSYGLRWPKTAPGAYASASCPSGYTGETVKYCEAKTGQHGVKWKLPDFSGCVADSLKEIYEQFTHISSGYSWTAVSVVLHEYVRALRSLAALPGAGEPPLTHATHILDYLMSTAAHHADRYHSAEHLLYIYDNLLEHPDAFLDEEKIFALQNAVVNTVGLRNSFDKRYHEFTVNAKSVSNDNAAHFDFRSVLQTRELSTTHEQPTPVEPEDWLLKSVGLELLTKNDNISVMTVLYHNIGVRLPSLRRSVEFRSGREIQYIVASQQVQMSINGADINISLPHTVTLLFTHFMNYSAAASKLACGLRTPSEPRTWNTQACEVRISEGTYVTCRCKGLGTFALFTVSKSALTYAEKDIRSVVKITVSLGAALCLVAALMQLLMLTSIKKANLSVLLKFVAAGTHSIAMLALIECDRSQEVACPGLLGWVCAVCWCTGCAALCAQPLLLHAELAGKATRAPSVGLLAGVCVLSWLTARLCSDAPLQLGTAAAGVCSAGAVLLTTLTLALTLCVSTTLRAVSRKLPSDRRSYVSSRRLVIRHTLILVFSTSLAEVAGVAYAQKTHTIISSITLCIAALANGLAMVICYVISDEKCLQSVRRLLTLSSNKDWQDSPAGDTSFNLYIKNGCEMECRSGLETSSSPTSPASSCWRAPPLERRQWNPDCRADIVQCVEYKRALLSPLQHNTHAVCDLIPTDADAVESGAPLHEYTTRECMPQRSPVFSVHSNDFQPCSGDGFDTDRDKCINCVHSNPDVSKVPSAPIKSCLKKNTSHFPSSASLPSMQHTAQCKREQNTLHIDEVNKTWNNVYDTTHTHTDKVLNNIAHDLHYLLNRTQVDTECTE